MTEPDPRAVSESGTQTGAIALPQNLPNLLTGLRIVAIPLMVLCYYLPQPISTVGAAVVFIVAAVTDWFDGWVARRLDQTSQFGAFLDPVADKLLVTVALILLHASHGQYFYHVGRDGSDWSRDCDQRAAGVDGAVG
jgi:phosphatidylglycerophosphate synthase